MTRAMFTVVVKESTGQETHHCANNLTVYDGQSGKQALAFISSGRLVTVPVEDVIAVTLKDGWYHCISCDGPMGHLSYGEEPDRKQA